MTTPTVEFGQDPHGPAGWNTYRTTCPDCGTMVRISSENARDAHGDLLPPPAATTRMWCVGCGNKRHLARLAAR